MDLREEKTVNRRARGLDRAFEILDALREAGRPLRPNEIAAAMGAPRSTIYEIVSALVKLDVLDCLLYTSPSPRDRQKSRMPSSA